MFQGQLSFRYLRDQIVGIDSDFETPFGRRLMVYCDYTASGRCLQFVEDYLQNIQRIYANTHTEDDLTGRSMTRLLHQAEAAIKRAVNAGPNGHIVPCGTGATGAIDKLQQIVGIALPPATRAEFQQALVDCLGAGQAEAFWRHHQTRQPVVFVGPYEHHSNEVSWRQGLATVVEVGMAEDGGIDLTDLERLLKEPAYLGRQRIGSFSAASNVTGMRTPVRQIATLLHRYHAYACFDYAASGPYVHIDMNPQQENGDDPSLDAIFVSPHKFLGGPGASGVLVFNERLYHSELPPSVAGGGTVDYVGPLDQDFIADIEEREKAGTPGVLQTLKAALAFEVKNAVGVKAIEAREHELLTRAAESWAENDRIEVLGNPDMHRRIGIVSFNLRGPRGRYLHPKLTTALLNDLFGIQSRAGCSCAGPYGHRLLGIDTETSDQYRTWVRKGYQGIKPGWCRVGFHYVMDDTEAQFVIDSVNFLGTFGHRFLPLYNFDLHTGMWRHKEDPDADEAFSLGAALGAIAYRRSALSEDCRARLYRSYMQDAYKLAETLGEPEAEGGAPLSDQLGELQFFVT